MHVKDKKIHNKALMLMRQGKLNLAHKVIKKSIKNSTGERCWLLLADICNSANMLKEYMQCCQNAIAINDNYAPAYSYIGRAYESLGNNQKALFFSAKAAGLESDNYLVQYNYGMLLRKLGMYDKAVVTLTPLSGISDNPSYIHYMIASCYQLMGKLDLTEFHFRESLKCAADNTLALVGLGFHYQNVGDYRQSIDYFDRAIAVSPDSIEAPAAKASLLVRMGKKEEAYDIIRQVVDAGQVTSTIVDAYSGLCDQYGDISEAIKVAEDFLKSDGLSSRSASSANFSLGMMLDKMGLYDKAFSSFRLANQASYISFDVNSYFKYIQQIIDFYNADYYSACSKSTSKMRPVFIVGMPRSGTSLVEQILSMHSNIYAAGELSYVQDIFKKILNSDTSKPADISYIAECDSACLTAYAEEYVARIAALSSEATMLQTQISTDKMPSNYLYLGLIRQMFPEAIILHCKRDPRDTCLSIYFQDFGGFQPYSCDLKNIARVYQEHDRLMHHWKNELDMNIYEVHYEEIVSDFEATIRSVLEHCGLEWEDACLNFYMAKRSVATASFGQVDKPIYNKSVARWKNYEKYIEELSNLPGAAL